MSQSSALPAQAGSFSASNCGARLLLASLQLAASNSGTTLTSMLTPQTICAQGSLASFPTAVGNIVQGIHLRMVRSIVTGSRVILHRWREAPVQRQSTKGQCLCECKVYPAVRTLHHAPVCRACSKCLPLGNSPATAQALAIRWPGRPSTHVPRLQYPVHDTCCSQRTLL